MPHHIEKNMQHYLDCGDDYLNCSDDYLDCGEDYLDCGDDVKPGPAPMKDNWLIELLLKIFAFFSGLFKK